MSESCFSNVADVFPLTFQEILRIFFGAVFNKPSLNVVKCFHLFIKLNNHCLGGLHKGKCYTGLKRAEAFAQRCSMKSHSKNVCKIHGKEPAIESFYSKGEVCNFTEKNRSHVSHDFCEIFQYTYTA